MRTLRKIPPTGLVFAVCAFGSLPAADTPPVVEPAPRPCAGCDAVIHPVLRSRNPELISSSKVQPRYPRRARRQKIEGQVILQCVVRKDGTVDDLKVLKVTAPGYGFEEAAMKAVRRWRFDSATFNGEPLDVYFTLEVEFRLDSPAPARGAAQKDNASQELNR